MKVTIDKAGRIVVPKSVRERYNMRPGTTLELENEKDGIILKVRGTEPTLIRKQGMLVHHGTETVDLDIASFVNREREVRNREVLKGQQGQ